MNQMVKTGAKLTLKERLPQTKTPAISKLVPVSKRNLAIE